MSKRFRFTFSGQVDLTMEDVYPDGPPKKVDLKKDLHGVTIQELLDDWGLMQDVQIRIEDLHTLEAIEISD